MSEPIMELLGGSDFLHEQSYKSRLTSLKMTYKAQAGHIAPDFSCLDILTVLYFSIMKLDPMNPNWMGRDRFVLSKGHAAGALYATLAARGFIPEEWLETYQCYETRLMGHPDRLKVPGVESIIREPSAWFVSCRRNGRSPASANRRLSPSQRLCTFR